jgi:hypothetical protein
MADRLTVRYRGGEFEVVRKSGTEAHLAATGATWQVTRDGAPLTSFPAEPGETDGSVREKVMEWLRANESRPAQDIGRQ